MNMYRVLYDKLYTINFIVCFEVDYFFEFKEDQSILNMLYSKGPVDSLESCVSIKYRSLNFTNSTVNHSCIIL